ncbi:hypothetical protein CDAR_395151 [Caerostris darwini]|uniref:Uncharacterized protein n=1 Tax=Caerostris darwini TaxID=1538125 RepID=A0AAV4QEV6_9ARAC|nr:hypothetical protein CDAR_395151 [Caerostris darwini]
MSVDHGVSGHEEASIHARAGPFDCPLFQKESTTTCLRQCKNRAEAPSGQRRENSSSAELQKRRRSSIDISERSPTSVIQMDVEQDLTDSRSGGNKRSPSFKLLPSAQVNGMRREKVFLFFSIPFFPPGGFGAVDSNAEIRLRSRLLLPLLSEFSSSRSCKLRESKTRCAFPQG